MTKKDEVILKQLQDDWHTLGKGVKSLRQSMDKCRKISLKDEYTFEELESFDSLTSKYARLSDILTQKVIKTIVYLLKEDMPSFIDKAILAEKLGIINDADILIEIRDLRNQIVHEYVMEQIILLYKDVFEFSPKLLDVYKSIEHYLTDKKWIYTKFKQ